MLKHYQTRDQANPEEELQPGARPDDQGTTMKQPEGRPDDQGTTMKNPPGRPDDQGTAMKNPPGRPDDIGTTMKQPGTGGQEATTKEELEPRSGG